ncbi:chemotaxis protein CheB [Adhaeribacter aquaticus]|uniref:chemotaxis protein CheB n=1 Tax=Adhaeribacter aquaticus TaxID=299567 RepID=UPI00041CD375|nr:chemotaxis protein CheB [Adhaeribacter aquaticus]
MQVSGHHIIVIGTSAGGMEALCQLLAPLPANLPAAIFIVQHLSADSNADYLVKRLARSTELACEMASHGTHFRYGTVYFAPSDHHLLINEQHILVAKGPRENQFRPSIDPLFRSAAAIHGSKVIGVILTGFLNDGLVGMECVYRCGGITVVQEPNDAEYPDLPRNVIRNLKVDYTTPVAKMGALLESLVHQPAEEQRNIPPEIILEAKIAQRVMINSETSSIADMDNLGKRAPYSCPDCGGSLWEINKEEKGITRFRCHSGHAYTDLSLLSGMNSALEETLWVAMRTLEERRNMLINLATQDTNRGNKKWADVQRERAEEMKVHIERIRYILEAATISDAEHHREAG